MPETGRKTGKRLCKFLVVLKLAIASPATASLTTFEAVKITKEIPEIRPLQIRRLKQSGLLIVAQSGNEVAAQSKSVDMITLS